MEAFAEKVWVRAGVVCRAHRAHPRGAVRKRITARTRPSPSLPQPPPTPQARQTLRIGNAAFEPTSLERYHRTLHSADGTAAWLREYRSLLDTFLYDGAGGWGGVSCTRVFFTGVCVCRGAWLREHRRQLPWGGVACVA